jgi:outer membrane protein, heavy metal efflux system
MSRTFVVLALAGSVGCVSVNPRPAFDDIGKRVEDRTGSAAAWTRDAAGARVVEERLAALLQEELTADKAVQVAFLASPSLQATFEELGVAKADLAQETRLANPTLDLEAVPLASGVTEAALGQDLLDVVLLPLRKKIGSAALEQAKLRVGDEMLRLALETKTAVYALQARRQLASRLGLVLDINRAAMELAQRQHAAGNINDLDLANQTTAYDQTRVELAQVQVEVRSDRERLNRLMGLWGPHTSWKVAEGLPEIPKEELRWEGLESLAIRQRFDVGAARFGVDLVGRALALKKGTRFLPVGVDVGVKMARESEADHRVFGPTLSVQVPIFDMGGASIARLEAQHRQTRRQLEAVAVNARSEVREARDRVVASRDRALFYRDVLLPQRVRILDLTLRHYNMMLKGAYELLQARQAEVDAERAYIEAWRDYWAAKAELEHAVGGRIQVTDAPKEGAAQ